MFADDGFGAAVDGAAVVGEVDDAVFVRRLWTADDVHAVLRVVVVVAGASAAAAKAVVVAVGGAVAVAVEAAVLSGRASAFAFFEAVGAGATERQQGKEDKAKGVFVFHGLFVPFCFCFVRMGLGLCAFIFRLSPRYFRTAFPSLPRCAGEGIFMGKCFRVAGGYPGPRPGRVGGRCCRRGSGRRRLCC